MKATFWGVRGCIPAPGADFVRYGGNTPCIEVRSSSGELVILDGGTGLIRLGKALMAGPFGRGEGEATLVFTHGHWDHIQGFPFFAPLYTQGNRFRIVGASASPKVVEELLEGQMNPHFMPVQSIRNMGAEILFEALPPKEVRELGGLKASAHPLPHGRVRSLAIRLEDQGRSLVYAPDVGYPDEQLGADELAFYRGADVLIHDSTYSDADYQQRKLRGYSSVSLAAKVAAKAEVKHLVLFHYDQDYDDQAVERLEADGRRCLDEAGGREITLSAAAEGRILEV